MYHYLRTEGTMPACYSKNVEWVQRQVYLPDLSDFNLQEQMEHVNGADCSVYTKVGTNTATSEDATYFSHEQYE